MKEQTRISVIVPVFNAEKYLSECIDSILSQTCHGLELILVNDGSTDGSEQIIETYIRDDRVVYLKQENKGVSSARNYGLSHASGEYIIFVDADDYLVGDSLEDRIEQAQKADLLISSYYRETAAGVKEKEEYINENRKLTIADALRAISPKSTLGYQGYLWNKVFRMSIIKKNKLQFDPSVAYGEDRLFVGTYITHCQTISLEKKCVYVYRINNVSAMNSFDKITQSNYKRVRTELDGLEKIEGIMKQYDEEIYQSFVRYEFNICLKFYNNSDDSVLDFKKMCKKRARERMLDILRFPPSARSIFRKTKAIVQYFSMR